MQEIKVDIAVIRNTQEHIIKKLDNIPACEKEAIKTKVAFQGKLIWTTFFLIFGGAVGFFVKTALAYIIN